jgi:hypothetical protein
MNIGVFALTLGLLIFGYIIYNTYDEDNYTYNPEQIQTVSRTVPSSIPDSWSCLHGDSSYGASFHCNTPEYGNCSWTELWDHGTKSTSAMKCER